MEVSSDLDELLNDALDDFGGALEPLHQRGGENPARHAHPADGHQNQPSAAKLVKFNPLPARAMGSKKKKGRKHSKNLSDLETSSRNVESAAGQNSRATLTKLAIAGADQQTKSGSTVAPKDTHARRLTASSAAEPTIGGQRAEQNYALDSAGLGGIADSLMHHLLSKEVLYQPMKDIGERYPAWLSAHRCTLSEEDISRYEEQSRQIQKILVLYEENAEDYQQLFEAMQQMQSCGQPPMDIVNDLVPGLSYDESGAAETTCCVQ